MLNEERIDQVRRLLRDALQLGARANALTASSALLGSVPELDSMAVVSVLTMMEDQFGISVDDTEISADIFATVGSLARFVDEKLNA